LVATAATTRHLTSDGCGSWRWNLPRPARPPVHWTLPLHKQPYECVPHGAARSPRPRVWSSTIKVHTTPLPSARRHGAESPQHSSLMPHGDVNQPKHLKILQHGIHQECAPRRIPPIAEATFAQANCRDEGDTLAPQVSMLSDVSSRRHSREPLQKEQACVRHWKPPNSHRSDGRSSGHEHLA
jgi:hypothetical protein